MTQTALSPTAKSLGNSPIWATLAMDGVPESISEAVRASSLVTHTRRPLTRTRAGVPAIDTDSRRCPVAGSIRPNACGRIAVSANPLLKRGQTLLLEPHRLALRESLIREIRKRRTPPQRQRVAQPITRKLRIPPFQGLAALNHKRLEKVEVELTGCDLKQIT